MTGECFAGSTAIGEVRFRFSGLLVASTFVLLSPATAPAGIVTTQPGTFISVELSDGINGSSGTIHTADIPGGAVFGGGVGSGTGESFRINSSDSTGHVSFSTAAYQDFGIFGGSAAVDLGYNELGVVNDLTAEAYGVSQEDWTITGGVGTGFLKLGWLVSGGIVTQAASNGFAEAYMAIDVSTAYFPPLSESVRNTGDVNTGLIHGAGFYEVGGRGDLPFIFGQSVSVKITSFVHARTGGPVDADFIGGALADFSHTETLSSIGVTDVFGHPISSFQITASSGTQYDANGVHFSDTNGAVPEPSSIVLCGVGALFLTIGSLRRRKSSRLT